MKRRARKQKRAVKTKKKTRDRLVYKRTEIDEPSSFNISKIYYPLVFISIIGILYLMFFSKVFNVSKINISGIREIDSEAIKSAVSGKLGKEIIKNNIFLLDKDSLSRELKKEYALKKIKIKKRYPDKVDIEVEEYVLELGWHTNGKYYLIDEKGKVVGELNKKREDIPTVEDKKNIIVEVGKSLVTIDFINFIKYLNQHFPEDTGAKISKIEINESLNEIIVYSDLKYYIIFDTTRDPAGEMKNLVTALGSKEINSTELTYLDMRVKNKIFYK